MASQKNELKKHIEYLYARRSGAEFCLDLVTDETDKAKIKGFIHNLSTSLQENQSKLYTIEQKEKEEKEAEKARLAALKRERQQA